MEGHRPIVIDNGFSTCKAGFAGDKLPGAVIPSVIARRRHVEPEPDPDQPSSSSAPINKDYYIGHEAKALQGVYSISRPVQYGVITNDINMEKIWDHLIYDQLGVESSDHPFLLTHSARCFESKQTKMCQIFFEKFCVPSLHVALNAALSLHASGRATGIVFDSGTEATQIVPIHEGVAIERGIGFSDLCGQDVTEYLANRLYKRGYGFLATRPGIDIVDGIKKETAFVYHGGDQSFFCESEKAKEWEFELPDGQTIRFGDNEAAQSAEGLFSPSVYGSDRPGPLSYLLRAVESSGHLRKELSDNVVLSGGNSLLPGFAQRLGQEYSGINYFYGSIKIIEPPNREYSSWVGGSMIASDPTFNDRWISKQGYDEVGPSIIQRGFSYIR